MIEVEVRDFQSIEHATIKIDGFTALVGRSNIGKSAFVRAVQACVTGAPVGAYVRHNALCPRKTRKAKECRCQCSVHIRAEQFDLLWEKGDFINRYTFNGTVYDKANQGTPDFLLPCHCTGTQVIERLRSEFGDAVVRHGGAGEAIVIAETSKS
mgnify:CR=1 FL=1